MSIHPIHSDLNTVDDLIEFLEENRAEITDAYVVIFRRENGIKWMACGNQKTLPTAALVLTDCAQQYLRGETA